jgi:hypothetical protein
MDECVCVCTNLCMYIWMYVCVCVYGGDIKFINFIPKDGCLLGCSAV